VYDIGLRENSKWQIRNGILVLRLLPCCWCRVFSFGYNPSVWLKWGDVSEPSVSSIFLDWMRRSLKTKILPIVSNIGIYC
jgi:hypothetical protein